MIIEGLDAVINDLGKAPIRASGKIVATTTRAVANIKDETRREYEGMAHAPHFPRSITWDVTFERASVVGEVGPDKDLTQGPLGNLIVFGSVNNPPDDKLTPALDREARVWQKHVEDAVAPW